MSGLSACYDAMTIFQPDTVTFSAMTTPAALDQDGIPVCDGPHAHPRKPSLKAPPGAIDCHAHIFGPVARYPFSPKRLFTPPDVSVSQYRQLLDTLGIARAVLVTPSVYGLDNERQLDALVEMRGNWRGVAVVPTNVADAELERLHGAGFRGVRVNLFAKSGLMLDDLEAIAARVSILKWHVQLHVDARNLEELAPRLRRLPVDVVFDHMGHVPAAAGVHHPGFTAMLDLMGRGTFWVKLSAPYRLSELPYPYADVTPFARALIDAAPDRVVWGSDWPHPAVPGHMPANFVMPNDADLLDILALWTDDPAQQKKILLDNPRRIYDFGEA
jgi:predicted TIM-barrel fold metal-dependent hydrolase